MNADNIVTDAPTVDAPPAVESGNPSNPSGVTSFNYVELATRTESTPEAMTIPTESARRMAYLANNLIVIGKLIDVLKRQMFYKDAKSNFDQAFTYSLGAVETARCPGGPDIQFTADQARLFHGLIGKTTELAELWETLGAHLINGVELDKTNTVEEIGDSSWYDALILDTLNVALNTALTANIDKLRTRYPAKFNPVAAVNRDTNAERQVLEAKVQ